MRLVYSTEEPRRLGTLGALYPLRDFLGEADVVLLVNGDSLCRWPIPRLVRRHLAGGAAATLLLAGRVDPGPYGGGVAVDEERRIVAFSSGETPRGTVARRHVFAGAHALSPELLARVEEGPADIVRQLYRPLLAEGARLDGVVTLHRWHDLGTPRRYLEGVVDWARGPWWRWPRRTWTGPGAAVARGARLSSSVIEAGATVEAGARLHRCLVMPGARVGAGAELRETIVGPDVELPARSRILRQVVVVARRGLPATEGDSHLDGLVYSPLDAPRRSGNPGL